VSLAFASFTLISVPNIAQFVRRGKESPARLADSLFIQAYVEPSACAALCVFGQCPPLCLGDAWLI